jgi:hypothetical protein
MLEYNVTYDMFKYIDSSGIALDDNLNELRDSEGMVFIVPEQDRDYFITIREE